MTTISILGPTLEVPAWKASLEESNYPEIKIAHDTIEIVTAALPNLSHEFIHTMAIKHRYFPPQKFFNYFNVPRLFYFIIGTMLWSSKLSESEKTPKHIFKTHTQEAFIFLNIIQDSPAPIIGKSWAALTFFVIVISTSIKISDIHII